MAVFVRKILGIGKLPTQLRAEVESENITHLVESVPVTLRFTGSVPGTTASGNVRSYVGALVITPERVLGTLSTVPKLAGRVIDPRWDQRSDGPVKGEFSGRLSLNYKTTLPEAVLTSIPRRSLAFTVPPEWVLRAVGVPAPRRASGPA